MQFNTLKIIFLSFLFGSIFPGIITFSINAHEKKFVIIVISPNDHLPAKTLTSIFNQNYSHFEVIYIDCLGSADAHEKLFENFDQSKINYIKCNERYGRLGTLWSIIHNCNDDKVIVFLSGNEYFLEETALQKLNNIYQDPSVWMASGILYSNEENVESSIEDSYAIIASSEWRKLGLRSNGPKTFYAWLFKQIKLQDLTITNDFMSKTCEAIMYPMLEMAQNYVHFIDGQLIANQRKNQDLSQKEELDFICTMEPYSPLTTAIKTSNKKESADLVVFSFDRPLQLYAFLESVERYISGVETISVIYRTSSKEMKKAYKKVKKRFSSVVFIEQSSKNPRQDFKEKTLSATFNSPNNYIIFAVDDIVVKDYSDISECIAMLQKTHAYAFYLRLGENVSYCYMNRSEQKVPNLLSVGNTIYAWRFNTGGWDWCCPNSLDMTLFYKEKIKSTLYKLNFNTPNYFEGAWSACADVKAMGICYQQSKIVNLPLNQVQRHSGIVKSMNISVTELLKKFNKGYKIDISPLYNINNNAVHMECVPTYIKRR